MKTLALVMAILAIAVSGYAKELQVNSRGKDCTIVAVPDQEETEWDHPDAIKIKKYDLTTYKTVKDIEGVNFTVIDKTERIDLHQLEYDNEQAQKTIVEMTARISDLQDEITSRNEIINTIKKEYPYVAPVIETDIITADREIS